MSSSGKSGFSRKSRMISIRRWLPKAAAIRALPRSLFAISAHPSTIRLFANCRIVHQILGLHDSPPELYSTGIASGGSIAEDTSRPFMTLLHLLPSVP